MSDASNNIISFYERNAVIFDNERSDRLFEKAWIDKFLLHVPADGSILDFGCGSGHPIAKYLVGLGYAVTGVDSSAKMIDMCELRFPNHKWILGDMRSIEFGEKFDGILAWDSFFHLPHQDQKCMISRFSLNAKSQAPLMFTAGPEHGEAINNLWEEPLYHASFSAAEYYELLEENGFDDICHKLEDEDCGGRSIYLARHI